jgi:hypothetical protein
MANTTAGLSIARANKKDEFYTQYNDIEKEVQNYKPHFKNAVVYCNCDDPDESNFYRYFANNFDHLELKKLICTHYENDENKNSYILITERGKDKNKDGRINRADTEIQKFLFSNGDFRSDECIELLKEADIVCTNPPFSLFREYIAQLMEYNKKFLIIGNQNAITYKEFFPLIKENKVWLGETMNGSNRWFRVPDSYENISNVKIGDGTNGFDKGVKYIFVKAVVWFTNMDYPKRHENFIPKKYKTYTGNESDYPKYDNYDAININNVNMIPIDYYGVMGVPITFLHHHNPDQFEILGLDDHRLVYPQWRGRGPDLNGKPIYRRLIIKRKKDKK